MRRREPGERANPRSQVMPDQRSPKKQLQAVLSQFPLDGLLADAVDAAGPNAAGTVLALTSTTFTLDADAVFRGFVRRAGVDTSAPSGGAPAGSHASTAQR